ncbi:MAG TPA: HEPN domain-containing protein [Pseudobdellovibrionaceae bacterium]
MAKSESNIQLWFKFSRVDLNMARTLFEGGQEEMWRGVTFHCQQAAEKAIKGYLVYKKIPLSYIHDIGKLATQVLVHHPELDPLMKRASFLTKYAILYRYPDADVEAVTLDQVKEAIACAKTVIDQMAALIPFESQWEI